MLFSSLLFGISASLDALLVGISYGIRGIRIRLWQNLFISTVTLLGTCLSVGLGQRLAPLLPGFMGRYAGSLILILLGFYYIAKWAAYLRDCRAGGTAGQVVPAEGAAGVPGQVVSAENAAGVLGQVVSAEGAARVLGQVVSAENAAGVLGQVALGEGAARVPGQVVSAENAAGVLGQVALGEGAAHVPGQVASAENAVGVLGRAVSAEAVSGVAGAVFAEVAEAEAAEAEATEGEGGMRLKAAEVFTLSLTLSLNNLSAGLSASLAGLTLLPAAASTILCSVLFLLSGNRLGRNPVLQLAGCAADPLSGMLLIGLGLIQIFI